MNLVALGYDPTRGTIGASRLGDVVGPDRKIKDRPLHKCAYVLTDDQGEAVGTCGTILSERNHGRFCALHTQMKIRGEKYVRSQEAKKRRRMMHLVPPEM